jgi:riboflavin kinase/FMN adenylyltransferase
MGLETVLVTFDPLPRAVISPESAPRLICDLKTRLNLLKSTGCVDHCVVLRFDDRMRHVTVDDFVVGNLVNRVGMRRLLVGENFACGSGRTGDVSYLAELGLRYGFSVEALPLHTPAGVPRCSSTEVRRLIQQGELIAAAGLLDRAHEIAGVVIDRSGSANDVRVAIDSGLCLPAKADYLGAFRIEEGDRPWRNAELKICDATSEENPTVRLTVNGGACAKVGDAVTMRLTERVASTRGSACSSGD